MAKRTPLKRQERPLEHIQADFAMLFDGDIGARVLAHLMSCFYVTRPTFVPGVNPTDMAFNEGCRFVVLRILALSGRLNPEDMEVLCLTKT